MADRYDQGVGMSWGGGGGYGDAPPSRDHSHPLPPSQYGYTSPSTAYPPPPSSPGYYADGGLDERPGASLDDLRNTISNMQASVKESQDRLSNPEPVFVPPVDGDGGGFSGGGMDGYGAGAGFGGGGGFPGDFGVGGDGLSGGEFPQEYRDPEIDTTLLPISNGFLHKKGGGLGGFRRWRKRYFVFFNTQLLYFDSERSAEAYARSGSSKPKGRITIDSFTRVYQGDDTKVHRNKDVKWDFVIECNEDRHLELYAETQQEAMWWIESIQLVINACMEANAPRPTLPVAPPPLDPEADAEEKERRRDAALAHRAYGPGLFEATRGEVASFFIQASDQFGNPMDGGGLEFKVTLSTSDLEFGVDVRDEGDGTYYVEYTPTQAGEHELEIKIDGEHILGSPASPIVSPAPTSASHCLARGDGLSIAQAGIVNEFTIVAMDQWDDVRPQGGDVWVFRTVGPVSMNPVRDLGNGAYVVSYTVDLSHPDFQTTSRGVPTVEIHAFLNNDGFQFPRPIGGGPFLPRIRMPLEFTPGGAVGATTPGHSPSAAGLPFYSPMTMPGMAGMVGHAQPTPAATTSGYPTASPSPHTPYTATGMGMGASPSGTPSSVSAAEAAAMARLEELQRKERELAARENALRQSEAALVNEKQSVDMKLQRLAELASRVKVDSERLQQRAQTSAVEASASSASSPFPPRTAQPHTHTSTPTPPTTGGVPPPPPPPAHTSSGGDRAAGGVGASVSDVPPPPPSNGGGYSARTPQLAQPPPPRSSSAIPTPTPVPPPPPHTHASASVSTEAPPELYEPEVLMLFDKHKAVLHVLHQRYSVGAENGVNLSSFVDMAKDFDITPVFVTKRDLRGIFVDACRAHSTADGTGVAGGALDGDHIAMTDSLTYPAFVEALGRIAIVALSKPAFHTLYPSSREKVVVMLEMWGLGDLAKVEEITAGRA